MRAAGSGKPLGGPEAAGCSPFAGPAVDELPDDIEVTHVPGVLLSRWNRTRSKVAGAAPCQRSPGWPTSDSSCLVTTARLVSA
jgi:hypothetical protein